MSLKKISEEKQNKFFRKKDLIIYILVAVAVAAVFLAVFLSEDKDAPENIRIIYADEVIFTMTIGEEGIIYSEVVTSEKTNYGYRVTVTTEKGTNIFEVNVGERTVTVENSDCEGGDCRHMKISKKSDSIVCLPHLLRVECTDGVNRPVSG